MTTCHAELQNDELTIGNDAIRRRFRWNDGNLVSLALEDLRQSVTWTLAGDQADAQLFASLAEAPASDGRFAVELAPEDARFPERLLVTVELRLGDVEVRRVYRLYDGCPAIACDLWVRGAVEPGDDPAAPRLDRLALDHTHLRLHSVEFFDVTDYNNNLVRGSTVLAYRRPCQVRGNLHFIEPVLASSQLFLLKEAPCSSVQLHYPGHDAACRTGEVCVVGSGVERSDLHREAWTRAYGVVVGVCGSGELSRLSALRSYQRQVRRHLPGRDHMVLMNTWGDRSQDRRMGAGFATDEIDAGARLGVTHLQLDDGWQSGRSSNSAFEGGSLNGIWERRDYWQPHPERFPEGLDPVVSYGRERGVEVCLWFNPSKDDEYGHWRDDADTLIHLHQRHGIRTFKIDGVQVPTKLAETRLRRMFDAVVEASQGDVVFNLDVTAGQRYGYHYFNEYGNIFVENRYTDAGSYYPHWSLRNLWQLSRYVPTQSLQIEFLNRWRNAARYPADDPLAPGRVPFDYCFAVTMVAQPLAWFEATGLPSEAFELAPLMETYRQHQERLHSGLILPIGAEPDGTGWTGFQSRRDDGGYFLVFREHTGQQTATLPTWLEPGQQVAMSVLGGSGAPEGQQLNEDGSATFDLPRPHTFAWIEYRHV